jgi:VanZ family protein
VIRVAFWTGCVAVTVASLVPMQELPSVVAGVWDKAQHALGFAGLGVLGLGGYPRRRGRVAIGLLLLGAAIEVAQAWTGWRDGDPLDWVADAVGVLVGTLAIRALLPRTGDARTPE